jgi:hypothetical protein
MSTTGGAGGRAAPVRIPLLVAVILGFGPIAAVAQSTPVTGEDVLNAVRLSGGADERPRIDGRVDEAFWDRVPAVSGFRQQNPVEADPATERTEVRIAYDDEGLYVAVLAFDAQPGRVVSRLMQRDRILEADPFGQVGLRDAGDDVFAILLDPFHDHRNGVIFATNPNGAEFEALITDEGSSINIDWRGVWEVAGMRTPDGWSAEFFIPWRTLRYPDATGDEPWGINFFRVIRSKNEQVYWRSWEREGGGLQRVSRAGHMRGLRDLPRAGLNVEAKPYALVGRAQERNEADILGSTSDRAVGLDLKSEVLPGLLLDLTLNTDFAQVEVDDAQVNLTRFNLFFPEKRDFFLENSGIFDFGIPGNPLETPAYQMFFSRQIGISGDGEVPIVGGARLTGRVGAQTVGFMSVVTDQVPEGPDFGAVDSELFSVARVKRDVGESNYIGAMIVDRRGDGQTNSSVGVDGQYLLGQAWVWDAFVARSFTEGDGGDGTAYRVGYQYNGEEWGSFFNHFGIGEEAEASAGFITRTDYRSTEMYGGRTWRPSAAGLREFQFFLGGKYASTMSDNRMQDWQLGFFTTPTWRTGDNISLFANVAETVVDEAFDLSDDVGVPVGRYDNSHVGWFGGSSRARPLSVDVNGIVSQFYGGSLVSAGMTATAALSPRFQLAPGFTRNVVDLPSGGFTADLTSLRASFSFSTRLFANALVQYNSLDGEFSTNVRLNFIHRPGSDLFLVFTENRRDDLSGWVLADRGVVTKLTYLMRF